MRTVTLATFNDVDHALPVVNRLQQLGFHPQLLDETKWQKHRFAETLASVKVRVDENEFEPARKQLKDWNSSEHLLDQAVCCPECGSADVDYPQVTRKFMMPTLHMLLFKLGLNEKEFYCHTCHHTWPLRKKMEPERDALNWPIKNSPLHENPDVTP
jgi:hypothetical protein